MLNIAKPEKEQLSTPPSDYMLEAEILGVPMSATMYNVGDPKAAMRHIMDLPRDAFMRDDHRSIFDAYTVLSDKKLSCTEDHLRLALTETGKWRTDESNGGIGIGFLIELREKGGNTTEISPLCNELRFIHWKRQCYDASRQLHAAITTWSNGPWEDVMSKFNDVVSTFNGRPNTKKKPTDIASLITKDLEILEQQASGIYTETLIKTGFHTLDNITGGFRPGNLVVVAGRPGMGKTSLALDFIRHALFEDEIPCAFFSFEMTAHEILRRLMSKLTKINVLELRHGNLREAQVQNYKQQALKLKNLPLDISDSSIAPMQLEHHIQALNRQLAPKQIGLVVIDHLQNMGTSDNTKYERRDRQLATYTGQLKDIAKRNECCVILLSQLNRGVEQRGGDEKEPRLSDLRDSGATEQDADVVLSIFLSPPKENEKYSSKAKLRVLKNRSGPVGHMNISWAADLATFFEQSDYSDVPF